MILIGGLKINLAPETMYGGGVLPCENWGLPGLSIQQSVLKNLKAVYDTFYFINSNLKEK